MQKQKRPLKFYLIIFGFSLLIVIGYTLYQILFNDAEVADVYTLWFMPFIFTAFYYGSDWLILKLTNRKKKVDYEAKFLDTISQRMRDANEFLVEEFRRLQINRRFQDDLNKAYLLLKEDRIDDASIERLERKYKKDSLEKRAMKYVVDYLKENQKKPDSD